MFGLGKPLNEEQQFRCPQCRTLLFESDGELECYTIWPSLRKAVLGAIEVRAGFASGSGEMEIHCRKCGLPLGSLFEDKMREAVAGEKFRLISAPPRKK